MIHSARDGQVMIDAVYTWVDGSDPAWSQRKSKALAALTQSALPCTSASSGARFFNRDELKYSLRSLDQYAPFVRKIFIVTAQQIPAWLRTTHPKIEVVFHQSIFPAAEDLPTFNSHAIEANLHRIAGLAEQFIYLNDDFAFFRPAQPADFFDLRGRALVYFDHRKVQRYPWWFGYRAPVNAAARNNSRLLQSQALPPVTRRLDHVPYALHKSVFEELWLLFNDELKATSSHKFRHADDVSTASSLAQHYALATGKAIRGPRNTNAYVKVKKYPFSSALIAAQLKHIEKTASRPQFVSVNDAGKLDASTATAQAIARFFESCFPNKSQFER